MFKGFMVLFFCLLVFFNNGDNDDSVLNDHIKTDSQWTWGLKPTDLSLTFCLLGSNSFK